MLARRTTTLLARRMAVPAVASSTLLQGRRSLVGDKSKSSMCGGNHALTLQQRNYLGQTLLADLAVHSTQLGGCLQLQTLLYSPLGTAMMLVLAYNVVVICTKHVNYSMEITAKDYVQDQQLYVIMRYGILSCILLGMEVMFVEV